MKPFTLVVATIVFLAATFTFGYSQGKKSVFLKQFEEYKLAIQKRDALQVKLDTSDVALLEAKKERDDARAKEVVKHVTVYRDKIKNPDVAKCVNDSGVWDIYNSTLGLSATIK